MQIPHQPKHMDQNVLIRVPIKAFLSSLSLKHSISTLSWESFQARSTLNDTFPFLDDLGTWRTEETW